MANDLAKKETPRDYWSKPDVLQEFARAIRTTITPAQVSTMVRLQLARNESLQKCSPGSILFSAVQALQLGLEPDGRMAALVPYKAQCTFQPMVQGLCQLAYRSGEISAIECEHVYEAELVTFNRRPFQHKQKSPSQRGDYVGTYAVAWMKDGLQGASEFMWREDIEAIKCRSASAKSGRSSPWDTDFAEMCRKTVIKRLCKRLPQSAELRGALSQDDTVETGDVITVVPNIHYETQSLTERAASMLSSEPNDVQQSDGADSVAATPSASPVKETKAPPCSIDTAKAIKAMLPNVGAGAKRNILASHGAAMLTLEKDILRMSQELGDSLLRELQEAAGHIVDQAREPVK